LSDDVSSDLSPEALAKQEASGVLDDGAKSENRERRHRSYRTYRSYRSHLTKCLILSRNYKSPLIPNPAGLIGKANAVNLHGV